MWSFWNTPPFRADTSLSFVGGANNLKFPTAIRWYPTHQHFFAQFLYIKQTLKKNVAKKVRRSAPPAPLASALPPFLPAPKFKKLPTCWDRMKIQAPLPLPLLPWFGTMELHDQQRCLGSPCQGSHQTCLQWKPGRELLLLLQTLGSWLTVCQPAEEAIVILIQDMQ